MMKKNTNEKTKQIIPISLWAIICFVFLFIGSFSTAQVYVKDSTVISIKGGAFIIGKTESEEKPVIYLSKGTLVKNLSQFQNYTIVYNGENIEKRNNSKSLVKNISKINKAIAKNDKKLHYETKVETNLCFKVASDQHLYNNQDCTVNCAILFSNTFSKLKVGFSSNFSFHALSFFSKRINSFFDFNNINKVSNSESFFTRPPPFGLV